MGEGKYWTLQLSSSPVSQIIQSQYFRLLLLLLFSPWLPPMVESSMCCIQSIMPSTQWLTTLFTQWLTTLFTPWLTTLFTPWLIMPFIMPHLLLMLSTLPPLMPQPLLLTSPLPLTRPRNTPMRFLPTPSPMPWLMTTPRPTSMLRRPPMVPAMSRVDTPLLFPMAESSTSSMSPTDMTDMLLM